MSGNFQNADFHRDPEIVSCESMFSLAKNMQQHAQTALSLIDGRARKVGLPKGHNANVQSDHGCISREYFP